MLEAVAREKTKRNADQLRKLFSERGTYDDEGVLQGGLMAFIRHFWHILEPATPLIEGWVLYAIVEHLEAVTFGEIQKLLMNVMPGASKSLVTDVFWPAWEWSAMGMPHLRYVAFSYSARLTERDNDRFTALILSPEFQSLYSGQVQLSKVGNKKVSNYQTGWKLATSVGGLGTGERGDRVILDDPHNVKEAESEIVREATVRWFREAMSNRLNNPEKSAIVIIMQRVHDADVSGTILELGLDYQHLCYDPETEILTEDGWVKFPDLKRGRRVMGVNPKTLQARWELPTSYIREPHCGKLIQFKSLTADLMVTPDHRTVYCDSNDMMRGVASQWRVRAARDLPKDFYLPQVVQWDGLDPEFIEFAGQKWAPTIFAKFMGWYLSEGCASEKRCNTVIVQKIGGQHVPDLVDTLLQIPFSIKVYDRQNEMRAWVIYSKVLAAALEPLGKSLKKRAPEILKQLNPKYLREFILAYARGDGHCAAVNPKKIFIGTGSERMAGDLQECAIKSGWSSTLSVTKNTRAFPGYAPKESTIFRVYLRASKTSENGRKIASKIGKSNISEIPYCGDVYCVSVPSTAIVVRRNGRITVSGNCIPMEFDTDRQVVDGQPIATSIGWTDPRFDPDDAEFGDGELAWPERWPDRIWQSMKAEYGPYAIASQYQQSPQARGGGVLRREYWQLWDAPDGKFPPLEYVIASLDSAFTEKEENDPSALVVFGIFRNEQGHPRAILLHAWRKRLRFHGPDMPIQPRESEPMYLRRVQPKWGLIEWTAYTCRRLKVDRLIIEGKASGISAAQELQRLHGDEGWAIEMVTPQGDKFARAVAVQPSFSQGLIYAPDRDWADMVMDEAEKFPRGKFKDLTDATTQAIKHLRDYGLLKFDAELQMEERARNKIPRKSQPLYPV